MDAYDDSKLQHRSTRCCLSGGGGVKMPAITPCDDLNDDGSTVRCCAPWQRCWCPLERQPEQAPRRRGYGLPGGVTAREEYETVAIANQSTGSSSGSRRLRATGRIQSLVGEAAGGVETTAVVGDNTRELDGSLRGSSGFQPWWALASGEEPRHCPFSSAISC